MIEFLGIFAIVFYTLGLIMLIFSLISFMFPYNKYVIKILNSLTFKSQKEKNEINERKKKERILKFGTYDEKIDLYNKEILEEWKNKKPKIFYSNTKPLLLLKEEELIKKYYCIDFNNPNVFIVNAPHTLFSLEDKKIVEDFDILEQKTIIPIDVELIETSDIESYIKSLNYDFIFIYNQEAGDNKFRIKTLTIK